MTSNAYNEVRSDAEASNVGNGSRSTKEHSHMTGHACHDGDMEVGAPENANGFNAANEESLMTTEQANVTPTDVGASDGATDVHQKANATDNTRSQDPAQQDSVGPFGDAARRHWDAGLPVIPLHRLEKRPVPYTWQQFADSMPTEKNQATWLAGWSQGNIGLPLGPQSGLCVLDIDMENMELVKKLEPVLPDSAWIRHGKKGVAIAYKYTGLSNAKIKDVSGRPLVELLGHGNQVAIPPSIHPDSRKPYAATADLPAVAADLNPLPDDIVAQLRIKLQELGYELASNSGKKQPAAKTNGRTVPEGGRNNALFTEARRLFGEGRDRPAVEAIIRQMNDERCDPPLSEDEVEKLLNSASGYLIFPTTEFELTDRMVNLQRAEWVFSKGSGWMSYDGMRWSAMHSDAVRKAVFEEVKQILYEAEGVHDPPKSEAMQKVARKWQNKSSVNNVESLLRCRFNDNGATEWDGLDDVLNTQDGEVWLRNGARYPHEAASLHTRITGAGSESSADCPRFERFMREIMSGDEDKVAFLKRLLGYSLIGGNPDQRFVICYGTGANGKSTLFEVLTEVLGDYAYNAPVQTFLKQNNNDTPRNDLASLVGRRLVIAKEPPEGSRLDAGTIKDITGGEKITARFLYGEHFEFTPKFLPMMATNQKPRIDGADGGLMRRLLLVPFKRKFADDEKDTQLLAKLLEERDHILAWLVEGYLEWQQAGLQVPASIAEETAEYGRESDLIQTFLDEECIVSPDKSVEKSKLYNAYCSWCVGQGERPMANRSFYRAMEDKGFAKYRSSGKRMFSGVEPVSKI